MPRTAAQLTGQVERSISGAVAGRSKLTEEILSLEGLSSPTVRHFLNNLCSFRQANYLEVGTWKGSTLISASYRNPGRFTAIDNFSLFLHSRDECREVRSHFRSVRRRFREHCRFTFHDADCWRIPLSRLPEKVNVYFYDGPHACEDQYRAFVHYDPVFANPFVAVVDDWNRPVVRKGTRDAFAILAYETVFEREFFTRGWFREFFTSSFPGDHWFNGMLVAVVKKPRKPPPRVPRGR